jgi:RND family efflux transporter MFP subunit
MKTAFHRSVAPRWFFLLLIAVTGTISGWSMFAERTDTAKAQAPVPAKVAKIVKEEQLNTITLTERAFDSLDLQIGTVERKTVERRRVHGGEVTAPVGKSLIVAAPVSGTLRSTAAPAFRAGDRVQKGTALFELLPLVTPEGRANLAAAKSDAQGQVKTAETQLAAAQTALDRAKKLLSGDAGSRRAVDEAQAQFDLATQTLSAANARFKVMESAIGKIEEGTAAPIPVTAPEDGILQSVSAVSGQTVPAGALLFNVVNLSTVWVRVAVYVGDLTEIDIKAEAMIGHLTAPPGSFKLPARAIAAPPTANAATGTVDLYYELENHSRFRPGERVGASLALTTEANSLTVPWSAVVHDIHGGTWVYEALGEREFNRRRVIVRYVVDGTAVLEVGPPAGTRIAAVAAQELFGTETGFSK